MPSLFLASVDLSEFVAFENVNWQNVQQATVETIYMTLFSMIAVFVFGLLLGLLLFETQNKEGKFFQVFYYIVAIIVNIFRAIPFIILIVLLIPFTRSLLGTMTGPNAALPALILSSAPFYARLVETSFRDVDKGVLEAANAIGANEFQIIYKVLIPESSPALIAGLTTTSIAVLGFTAMAGVIGAGGLGNLAYLQGFQRSNPAVTLVATLVILVLVFIIQGLGDLTVKLLDKR